MLINLYALILRLTCGYEAQLGSWSPLLSVAYGKVDGLLT